MSAAWSFIARLATLVTGFASSLLATRIILSTSGVENFALYSIIVALPALIPFTDLGAGAVLVNSYAARSTCRHDDLLQRQTTTVARIMVGFALAVMSVNVLLLVTEGWQNLLGNAATVPHAELVAFVCLTSFCVSIPLGIWTKVLLGSNKNHLIILLQGVQAPLALGFVWVLLTYGPPAVFPWVATAVYAAMFVVAIAGFAQASRTSDGALWRAVLLVPRRRTRGVRVMDVGLPMFAQMLTPPITTQVTRLIVAQSVSIAALAEYGVLMQVLIPALGLVSAVGLTLLPYYARARGSGARTVGPLRLSALFFAAASAGVGTWVLVSPWLFHLMSAGAVVPDRYTVLCFGLQLMAQSALYPLGMFLMNPTGIRFQVIPAILVCISTVSIVSALAPVVGITIVPIAVAVSTLVFQIVPFVIYIRRGLVINE